MPFDQDDTIVLVDPAKESMIRQLEEYRVLVAGKMPTGNFLNNSDKGLWTMTPFQINMSTKTNCQLAIPILPLGLAKIR